MNRVLSWTDSGEVRFPRSEVNRVKRVIDPEAVTVRGRNKRVLWKNVKKIKFCNDEKKKELKLLIFLQLQAWNFI